MDGPVSNKQKCGITHFQKILYQKLLTMRILPFANRHILYINRRFPIPLLSWLLYTTSRSLHCEAYPPNYSPRSNFSNANLLETRQRTFDPLTAHSLSTMSEIKTMKVWEDGREQALERCIVPLSSESHKGSSGRVGVLGGSAQYTGAPFYASMASLHTGSDLAYIFCAQEASLPLKCYSPELMVSPVYTAADFDRLVETNQIDSEEAKKQIDRMVTRVTSMMDKLHCLVIGPGLGRCPLVMKAVARIIAKGRELNLHMVFDADALYMLSLDEYRNLLKDYDRAILTPNVVEYKRLFDKGDSDKNFASVMIVQKGKHDSIAKGGDLLMACEEEGGMKRSGGIGDVLSGTLGTLAAWHTILMERGDALASDLPLSCWTACCFVKRATKRAFDDKRRAMTAPDVLDALGASIDTMTN